VESVPFLAPPSPPETRVRKPEAPIQKRLARAVGSGLERQTLAEKALRLVSAGTLLYAHDLLRTRAGITGEIVLEEGSRVKLKENTTLRLWPRGLVLYEGILRIQAEPQKTWLRVHTPTGVRVEVVGTEFQVAFSKTTTQTTVTVLHGSVRVSRGSAAVTVQASEQCLVGPAGPPYVVQGISGAEETADSPLACFEIIPQVRKKVFPTPAQPCTFTLRLHNRSGKDRPLEVQYKLTDLQGRVVQVGHQADIAPTDKVWEKPLSIQVPGWGLYTLWVTVEDGETALERKLNFAVEEESREQEREKNQPPNPIEEERGKVPKPSG